MITEPKYIYERKGLELLQACINYNENGGESPLRYNSDLKRVDKELLLDRAKKHAKLQKALDNKTATNANVTRYNMMAIEREFIEYCKERNYIKSNDEE